MQIGQLFILRINIHLQGSVLDSPELMWAEPQLEPVYGAVRSYLEMDQRVGLLTERLDVIADLLAVLKDQVRTSHGEYLEWIGELSYPLFSFFLSSSSFPPLVSSPFYWKASHNQTTQEFRLRPYLLYNIYVRLTTPRISNYTHRGRNPRRGYQHCRRPLRRC